MRDGTSSDWGSSFLVHFLAKTLSLLLTIVIVWIVYAFLHAYRLDWLGWIYSKLLPITNGLYGLVETYFPADVKYKVRGAITDDLGQRSLFLLLLTAVVDLALYALAVGVKTIVTRASGHE